MRRLEVGDDGIVVRFNGGAQAGHTVVAPDGRRHVFSHVGSGALAGAASHPVALVSFRQSHPVPERELAVLAAQGRDAGTVAVDPASPVTTPYDMLINQIVERARGDGRHGSCGGRLW
jgi:adenylosuccinate synthase